MSTQRRLIQDLRRARVLVVHPRDEDGDTLVLHLKRLGCEVRAAWPLPTALPAEIDTLFIYVDNLDIGHALEIVDSRQPAVIAVSDYESPTALQAIIDLNAHGVISKPLRPLGILSQFALARYRHSYERRLSGKVLKLEETLKSRRVVDKAVVALGEMRGLEPEAAYLLIRDQATEKRISMAAVAQAVVAAHETMKGLEAGLGSSPKKGR